MTLSITLTIIFFVLFLILVNKNTEKKEEVDAILVMLTLFVFFGIVSAILYVQAVGIYPYLKAKESKVLALRSEIIKIKKSFYVKGEGHSLLIGGSLDNMKQSTNLSLYISKYAKSKSNFAYSLTNNKTACNILPYWILGSNIAMDCPAIEKINPKFLKN